jgi:hypothetical protein
MQGEINMKEVIEISVNPEKKFSDIVESGRKTAQGILPGEPVKFVGWQLHYLIGKPGEEILQSMNGWAAGFNVKDYEE